MATTTYKSEVPPLVLGVAGKIVFSTATADAKTMKVSKNGGAFAAANAGTTAAAITGGTSTTLFLLTINAADVSAEGPICFEVTGAGGDIEYLKAYVHAWNISGGILPASGIPVGAFANNSITAAAIANGAIDAATFAAGAIDAAAIATDAIDADAIAADAAVEINSAVSNINYPMQEIYRWGNPKERTVYWEQLGTLPATCVLVRDGAAAAASTAAPAKISSNHCKLVLTAAECNLAGVIMMVVASTSTGACTCNIPIKVCNYNPFTEGAMSDSALKSRSRRGA